MSTRARGEVRTDRRDEGGYVAVVTAMVLVLLMGLSAFAVDVGHWYLVGQRAQKAADAAALAGVTSLPGNETTAFSRARTYATGNGFTDGVVSTVVTPSRRGPTKLRVDVTQTVDNMFGGLLGRPTTAVTRHAVADYVGPVPMGSPCNEYGNDPEASSSTRGSACSAVTGNFWANVNSPTSTKQSGDAFSSTICSTSVTGLDGCSAGTNTEYDPNGYLFTIDVTAAVPSLAVELFDPVFVNTGVTCGFSTVTDPAAYFTSPSTASNAVNPWHSSSGSSGDRYARVAAGSAGSAAWKWCTGDNMYSGTQVPQTRFTLRAPGTSSWDPLSGPVLCSRTYKGYSGNLYPVLNQGSSGYDSAIAASFRRWVSLCTVTAPVVGKYSLQVTSSVGGSADSADAGNRYAVRALASDLGAVSVSGRERMGMFANKNGSLTSFHLARVPSGTGGSSLRVGLYDVGDSSQSGRIRIVAPDGSAYSGCTGSGVTTIIDSDCSFGVPAGSASSPSPFNGRYQYVSVPIPTGYSCNDSDPAACWVTLVYDYGSAAQPTDVTAWTAQLEGDPIRLIE